MSGHLFNKSEKILSDDAVRVQNEIIEKIKNKYNSIEILPIGSVGKKIGYCGDIDIAIKCNTFDDLKEIVKSVFPNIEHNEKNSKNIFVYSICYPYNNVNGDCKYVQCDFMVMVDKTYTMFRYYCPDFKNNESKYKVYARILLWNILLNHTSKDIKYNLSPVGLFSFKKEDRNNSKFVTRNIDEIIHIVFDDSIRIDDVLTVENIWKLIHSEHYKFSGELCDIEYSFFKNAYIKPWEELNLDPHDFELVYWDADEIVNKLKKYDSLNSLNTVLIEMQKK